MDAPELDRELKRLLREDLEALSVRYELVTEAEDAARRADGRALVPGPAATLAGAAALPSAAARPDDALQPTQLPKPREFFLQPGFFCLRPVLFRQAQPSVANSG